MPLITFSNSIKSLFNFFTSSFCSFHIVLDSTFSTRAVDRMSKLADPLTGEFLPMVASDDSKIYHPLPIDLDRVALAVGTAGRGEKQKRDHAKERRLHARGLEHGRDEQGNHNQR